MNSALYYSDYSDDSESIHFLRFYPDGVLIGASIYIDDDTPIDELVKKLTWFTIENYNDLWSKGYYKFDGKDIYFELYSSYGCVLYEGAIQGDQSLILEVVSLINEYKSIKSYTRYPIISEIIINSSGAKEAYFEEFYDYGDDYETEEPVKTITDQVLDNQCDANSIWSKLTLNTAREKYQERSFIEAKALYDLYLSILNLSLDLHDLSDLQEIEDEYIKIVISLFDLNISETNPIFKRLDKTKQLINNKLENNEALSEYEDNVRKLLVYKTFYTVSWGQYAGNDLASIINDDQEYLLWCIINLEHFSIDNAVFLIRSFQNETQYLAALEINLIKQLILEKWGDDDNDEDGYYNGPDDYDDGPSSYGYDSWDEMAFNEAFEGDIDAWNHYNQ